MLLTIQFPFTDLRGFFKSTGRLTKPGWPIPTPDDEFVRFFGAVRYRKLGGLSGWVGENEICEANRFMRLSYCPKIKDAYSRKEFVTGIAFRRLYFDGLAVGKFELGISTRTRKKVDLSKQAVKDLVDSFLHMPIRLRESRSGYKNCLLGHSAQYVASLYYHATTKNLDEPITSTNKWMIRPGIPILFLVCQSEEVLPLPYWSRNVEIKNYDFNLYNCLVPFQGKNFRLWLLDNHLSAHYDIRAARRLRIYLLRLNAEHESLRLVLRNIISKNIDVKPRSKLSDNLQYYLNEATRRIGILDSKSSNQFEDEICDIARESMNTLNPGQKDALVNVLKSIDVRKNILRKVEDYVNKWGNITIIENIEEAVMGDVIKDINQSIIATRGAIAQGVITLKNQGKNDLADVISELDKIISLTDSKILSKEKKAECSDLLNGITDQAKKPEPNKSIMRSLGTSLIAIIETIEPIAKVAGKGIEFIKHLWI